MGSLSLARLSNCPSPYVSTFAKSIMESDFLDLLYFGLNTLRSMYTAMHSR